jgi:hypothetical protein
LFGAFAGGAFVGFLTGMLMHAAFFTNSSTVERLKTLRQIILVTIVSMIGSGSLVGWLKGPEIGACYLIGLFSLVFVSVAYMEARATGLVDRISKQILKNPRAKRTSTRALKHPRKLTTKQDIKDVNQLLDDISRESPP